MSVTVEPYDNIYKKGVIECLRRNYQAFSIMNDMEMEEWLAPITDYCWTEGTEVSLQEHPYKYGAVVLDGGEVVGYLGMILSRRIYSGEEYVYGSPSTWAVDEKYRLKFFSAMKLIFEHVDVLTEYTARKSVEMTYRKVFHYEECGNKVYRIFPIPYIGERHCEVDKIRNKENIADEEIAREFADHNTPAIKGISLVRYGNDRGQSGYIFYKKYEEDDLVIRIMKVSNPALYTEHCHEISWNIIQNEYYNSSDNVYFQIGQIIENVQKGKKVCIECDEMLVKGYELKHPYYKETATVRLYKSNLNIDVPIDFLYSEYSNLNSKI